MKILQLENMTTFPRCILVLGYFDGLHRGHQALFKEARSLKERLNLPITVLTFPEKPTLTFEKFTHDMLLKLTSDKKRAQLFEANGVDTLIFKELSSHFAHQTGAEFFQNVILKLNPQAVVTGFDYTMGSDMVGLHSTQALKVITVPVVEEDEVKISSTRIREGVKKGLMARVNLLLGWTYETTGIVVHGFARGRQLGYPTANLVIKDFIHIPAPGVYVCDVLVEGKRRRGFASIGYNDTFDGTEETVEVHIFDFNGEIYGESLTIFWLDKIREMVKFDGMDMLVKQMKADEKIARAWEKDL